MKNIIFALIIMMITLKSFGQAPFTTLVKEPRFLEKRVNLDSHERLIAVTDSNKIKRNNTNSKLFDEGEIIETKKTDIDFFKNNGLTVNLINKGLNRMSVNSQVLHYKLYFANPNEKNKYRLNRYNIPLLIVTKLSTTYDSINATSALDVLDYEAAPITLRIMPSFKQSFVTYNDVFYYGLYADIRGINVHNPESNSYKMDFIYSGGIGFTYQGDGVAGTYNNNGEYTPGRYSISVILQGATGRQEFISNLFKTDKNYITSLQSYFIFKVSETSQLNIKIGYMRFFKETISGIKSNFTITLGI